MTRQNIPGSHSGRKGQGKEEAMKSGKIKSCGQGKDLSESRVKDTVVPFEEPQNAQSQAAVWLAKLDGDSPSKEDLQAFRQWVNEDDSHIAAFEKATAVWDEYNILTRLPMVLQQRLQQRRGRQHQQRFRPKRQSLMIQSRYLGVAITVVLAIFMGLYLYLFPPLEASYSTAIGEQKTISLPDSSVVQLNTNSRITFDYSGAIRAIYLHQGEAHFDVASNPQRPFEVYVGTGRVRAVGTAFTVMVGINEIDVVVTEGTVEVAPEINPPLTEATSTRLEYPELGRQPLSPQTDDEESRRVGAGNAVVFTQDKIKLVQRIETDELQRRLAWQRGLLIFSGEPLEEVIAQVSRYTDTKILIKSTKAKKLRIGGQFQVGDTKAILNALERGFGIKADYITNSLVYLSYKK